MASPPSHAQSVLPDSKALVLDRIERVENRFILSVHGRQAPRCPRCSRVSSSRHSSYVRNVQDLPWQGLSVQIRLKVRRFRCRNRNCGQKIFSERLPGIVRAYGRRSDRLGDIVRLIGYSLGGLPASRILERLAVPISDDTVLREVKHSDTGAPAEALRHVGVDDWAWRKGHAYGTILVDLERHKVIELLPDRSAESAQRWLEDHPGIATINRDRWGLYADGASRGAPDVVQIADRFHLALNLSAAIERALDEHRDCLQLSGSGDTVERTDQTPTRHEAGSFPERRKQQNRQNRLERYETVMDLHRRGHTQRSISETVGLSLKTVRRWLRLQHFPERKSVVARHSHVGEFRDYLRKRWEQGCHNSTQLFREIRTRGYCGSRQMVSHHVSGWRRSGPATRRNRRISPKEAAILVCKPAELRTDLQQDLFRRLTAAHPTFSWLHIFACDFREALQSRDRDRMDDWIRNAAQSGIGPLVRFAYGLRRDHDAVLAAVESPWSSGQVEGQINRLKAIKRQMYGRAGFALLRARVLPYSAAAPP
jgi:transposase